MTSSEEQFDIFTPDGSLIGQAARSRVHREGLWHKSAQVFLFDPLGRLILQRRVAHKDVCGGLWDQSVAEHLKPGESYHDAAIRGLMEELGVAGVVLTPLGEPFSGRLDQPALGIHDYEFQQAFAGNHDGPVHPDPSEVDETRAVALSSLADWIRDRPGDFTPWFLRDAVRCGIVAET